MAEENLTTPESVPEASDVSAAEGKGAEASLTLDQVKDALGKDFKDVDSALKSIKDTYNYVGSQAQFKEQMTALTEKLGTDERGVLSALEALAGSQKAEVKQAEKPQGDYVSKEQYETDNFFAGNKQLEGLKDVLVGLKAGQSGVSWNEFMQQPHIAQLVEQNQAYSEMQSKKSVVESNPRVGQALDKITQAKSAVQQAQTAYAAGDMGGANQAMLAAKEQAIDSVIDTLR